MTTQDDSQTTKLIWPTETRVLIGQEKFDLLKSQTSVHTVTSLAIGPQNMSAIWWVLRSFNDPLAHQWKNRKEIIQWSYFNPKIMGYRENSPW